MFRVGRFTAAWVVITWVGLVSAHAASITFLGGGTLFKPKTSGYSGTLTQKTGYGGGGELGIPLGRSTELSVGALYMIRKYNDTLNVATFGTLRSVAVELPLLLRIWLSRSLNLGLGGYYALLPRLQLDRSGVEALYGFGDVRNEAGALASLAFAPRLSASSALVFDARYAFGLTNFIKSTRVKFYNREIQAFVGLRFGLTK